jgi:hypothetical protein
MKQDKFVNRKVWVGGCISHTTREMTIKKAVEFNDLFNQNANQTSIKIN